MLHCVFNIGGFDVAISCIVLYSVHKISKRFMWFVFAEKSDIVGEAYLLEVYSMAERKEYRSSARSRRMIREAFLELLEEKKFEKITVTDIVDRADLNRSTFYAHYPDVYGVVEEIQKEIINRNMELIKQIEYRNILKDPIPYLNSICDTLEVNTSLFTRMGQATDIHQLLDKYQKMIVEDVMNDPDIPEEIRNAPFFEVRIHFFVGGIMNTYQQWMDGKLDYSLPEISMEIAGLIRKSAIDLMDSDWLK